MLDAMIDFDSPGARFSDIPFAEMYPIDRYGWMVWDDETESFVRDRWCPVVLQPSRLPTAFSDAIAQRCRQDWIEEYHHLLSVSVHHKNIHPVASCVDVERDKIGTFDNVLDVTRNRPLKQHVSFPALEIGARVGSDFWFTHELFPFPYDFSEATQ